MYRNSLSVPARFLLSFFFLVVLQTAAAPKNLPDVVVRAHSVFIVNETGFNELEYPLILEINKRGRFELAASPEKAPSFFASTTAITSARFPLANFPRTIPSIPPTTPKSPKGTRASCSSIPNPTLCFALTLRKPRAPRSKMAIFSTGSATPSTPTTKPAANHLCRRRASCALTHEPTVRHSLGSAFAFCYS